MGRHKNFAKVFHSSTIAEVGPVNLRGVGVVDSEKKQLEIIRRRKHRQRIREEYPENVAEYKKLRDQITHRKRVLHRKNLGKNKVTLSTVNFATIESQ